MSETKNAWERIRQREAALEQRIDALERQKSIDIAIWEREKRAYEDMVFDLQKRVAQLESDRDELFAAMERARIPRHPM